MGGKGTKYAIFVVRQLHEKYRAKGKTVHFGFVDLENAFDRVPMEIVCWAISKLRVNQ